MERITPEPTKCQLCHQKVVWLWNSPYSTLGDWYTEADRTQACPENHARRYAPHVPVGS